VCAVNVTTGGSSSWQLYSETASLVHNLTFSSYGDLVEIQARTGTDESSLVVGTVPAPADAAQPDLIQGGITHEMNPANTNFTVSGDDPNVGSKSITDSSFPVTVQLAIVGGATSSTITVTGSGNANATDWTLTVAASPGDRAVLSVTDDYGNTTDLHYICDKVTGAAAWIPSSTHNVSPNQADSEHAGTAGMISAGDGNSAITVKGQDFLHSVMAYVANAPIQSLPVRLSYRSGIAYDTGGAQTYDGPVGKGFDWNLDSRIELSGSSYYWYPGDGRKVGPFTYKSFAFPNIYYDSPPGVFSELVYSVIGESYLTDATGTRQVFSNATKRLTRIEDYYGYTASTDPELNQVRLIRDDVGKVVQAILGNGQLVHVRWFNVSTAPSPWLTASPQSGRCGVTPPPQLARLSIAQASVPGSHSRPSGQPSRASS